MKTKTIAAFLLLWHSGGARADLLGVTLGADYWNYDISGSARYKTKNAGDDIDVNDDLGYDDDSLTSYYIALEHPLPVLPHVRLRRTDIEDSADGRLSKSITYGGITFNASEAVASDVQLDQTDITLYYEVLDNIVDLDLGLNVKYLDIDATLHGAVSGTESADVSAWVPMLYAGAGVDLPLTGLGLDAEVAAIGYQGSRLYDVSVAARYTTPWFLGVQLGYRKLKLDLDDIDDITADIEFDGPYAGAYLRF